VCHVTPQTKDIRWVLTCCTTCVCNTTKQRQHLRITVLHAKYQQKILWRLTLAEEDLICLWCYKCHTTVKAVTLQHGRKIQSFYNKESKNVIFQLRGRIAVQYGLQPSCSLSRLKFFVFIGVTCASFYCFNSLTSEVTLCSSFGIQICALRLTAYLLFSQQAELHYRLMFYNCDTFYFLRCKEQTQGFSGKTWNIGG
jgi:hypothetical protein